MKALISFFRAEVIHPLSTELASLRTLDERSKFLSQLDANDLTR